APLPPLGHPVRTNGHTAAATKRFLEVIDDSEANGGGLFLFAVERVDGRNLHRKVEQNVLDRHDDDPWRDKRAKTARVGLSRSRFLVARREPAVEAQPQ